MDHQLLCSWLALPAGSWPPNHYVLLGLEPGADDAAAIEASVHERMGILRRYQLTHPELATEAMNRLAQAMICLTDETARTSYVAELAPPVAVSSPVLPAVSDAAPPVTVDQIIAPCCPGKPPGATDRHLR